MIIANRKCVRLLWSRRDGQPGRPGRVILSRSCHAPKGSIYKGERMSWNPERALRVAGNKHRSWEIVSCSRRSEYRSTLAKLRGVLCTPPCEPASPATTIGDLQVVSSSVSFRDSLSVASTPIFGSTSVFSAFFESHIMMLVLFSTNTYFLLV